MILKVCIIVICQKRSDLVFFKCYLIYKVISKIILFSYLWYRHLQKKTVKTKS